MASRPDRSDGELTLDRLPDPAEAVDVVPLEGVSSSPAEAREPHRHAYHELIWMRSGSGHYLIDGDRVPGAARDHNADRAPGHVFECAERVDGAVVRFGEELLFGGTEHRIVPGWLLAGRCGRSVAVPAAEAERLDAVIEALRAEVGRPHDAQSAELRRQLVSVILLWIERGTGSTTKELVTDRVMVEAASLLRFSDLTAGQIAYRVGFSDPLYFSRAFKRHQGESPTAYRARVRGSAKLSA
jgi:AraC family transcriptional regulator, transcriptional activator of pobA